jgi:hypothetical protein
MGVRDLSCVFNLIKIEEGHKSYLGVNFLLITNYLTILFFILAIIGLAYFASLEKLKIYK